MHCIMFRVGVSGPRRFFEGIAASGEVLLERFFCPDTCRSVRCIFAHF